MVIKGEKTMALIFKTGKIVCSGSKTEESSKNAIKKYAKTIKQFRYKEAKFKDYEITNFIGVYDFEFKINLSKLKNIINDIYHYEPKLLSGKLIYYMNKPKLTLLFFSKGKIIFICDKEKEKINEALKIIYPLLVECKNNLEEFNNI